MPNALASESSPYLRQHAENPVDWLPWGPAAMERARQRELPLLVSIGYAACHWCHVMERESFADAEVAALMNERFVCVKVDREQHPQVDAAYMEAVQAMTGQGGWPLNVFCTPDGTPFFGGTYFPPEPRAGMSSWREMLTAADSAWRRQRERVDEQAGALRRHLSDSQRLPDATTSLGEELLAQATIRIAGSYDSVNGGFGSAPKFPQACLIDFLLARAKGARSAEAQMALGCLHAMASGGIHDLLGGGFHRYSVDARWREPHFEKMLYDNALLAAAYTRGHLLSGEPRLAEVACGICDWALRELGDQEGGFASSLDADSGGIEGSYYLWSFEELSAVAGEHAEAAIAWLGLSPTGNIRGSSGNAEALNVLLDGPEPPPSEQRERIRSKLIAHRRERIAPQLDGKRIAGWNALMAAALAEAGSALGQPRYTAAAESCMTMILTRMRNADGTLLRIRHEGRSELPGQLDDHAFVTQGLTALFESTCEQRWLDEATRMAELLIEQFADPDGHGFFSTTESDQGPLGRRKELEDNPLPSGYSGAASALLRLSQLTGEQRYSELARSALEAIAPIAERHPQGFAHSLEAIHWLSAPARAVACRIPSQA